MGKPADSAHREPVLPGCAEPYADLLCKVSSDDNQVEPRPRRLLLHTDIHFHGSRISYLHPLHAVPQCGQTRRRLCFTELDCVPLAPQWIVLLVSKLGVALQSHEVGPRHREHGSASGAEIAAREQYCMQNYSISTCLDLRNISILHYRVDLQ